MKRTSISLIAVVLLTIILFSFSLINDGAIQGKITPVSGSQAVLVIVGRDTITAQVNSGKFLFPKVKPGTYTVLIRSIPPLNDTTIVNVAVVDGTTTDLGEISLRPSL
jgi:hypothetical protein